MIVSPYKLSIFQRCPLRYKLQYIDFLGDKYKKEWPHFIFGRAVRKALADFFLGIRSNEEPLGPLRSHLAQC